MMEIWTVLSQRTAAVSQQNAPAARQPECTRLIKEVAEGDRLALARLYECTSGLLFGLLLRILSHSQKAEEVLAQVYLEVWQQQAAGFDGNRESALTWLVLITHRRALAELHQNIDRQPTRVDGHQNSAPAAGGDREANIAAQEQLVRSAIEALSPMQKEMLELSYFSGMTDSEIAHYLGFPLETVRLGLCLALKKLSALFSFLDLPERKKPTESFPM